MKRRLVSVLCLLAFLLALSLLLAGGPIWQKMDEGGCQDAVRQCGLQFSRYEGQANACWGRDVAGNEVRIY